MAEWKIKGAAEDVEQKSAQEQEQAVLDKAVEEGKIERITRWCNSSGN